VVERAFLEIDGPAWIDDEAIGRVMRVRRVDAHQHTLTALALVATLVGLEQH
jgi:hypothetical protein